MPVEVGPANTEWSEYTLRGYVSVLLTEAEPRPNAWEGRGWDGRGSRCDGSFGLGVQLSRVCGQSLVQTRHAVRTLRS